MDKKPNSIIKFIKIFYLDHLSWILFILSVALNCGLYIIWKNINYSLIPYIYSLLVLVINSVFAFIYVKIDPVISNFLLGTCLLVQTFLLILINKN